MCPPPPAGENKLVNNVKSYLANNDCSKVHYFIHVKIKVTPEEIGSRGIRKL